MSVKYAIPKSYRNLKMFTTLTMFEYAGDTLRYSFDKIDSDPLVNADKYFNRHTVIKGSFTGELAGMAPRSVSTGFIWPDDGIDYHMDSAGFLVTADEDDTQLHCVHPYPGCKIEINRVPLAAGETHTISQGTISLIFGTGFTVNGNASTDNPKILVCQNSSADIVASAECEIIKFTAVEE
jgi:hypothetical protein